MGGTPMKLQVPRLTFCHNLSGMHTHLPGDLAANINEVYLMHGTRPENVMAILNSGLDERYSRGIFGLGTYLAEDVAKCDQYCTSDASNQNSGPLADLHRILFPDETKHPGNLCYVFVCRVTLGYPIVTQDGSRQMHGDRSVWGSLNRELPCVPGTEPQLRHHSLRAELGTRILRFREFIVFHGEQIYPEYLVAYRRVRK